MTEPMKKRKPDAHLARHLTRVLADSYLTYHSTQFCHWNVVGDQFRPLHMMFEEQYRDLAEAIDVIAERIRILGFFTPGTLGDYVKLGSVEQREHLHAPEDMLRHLIECHEATANRLREAISVAQEASDEATLDLLVERLRAHEKAGWMLESQAGREAAHLEIEEAVAASA